MSGSTQSAGVGGMGPRLEADAAALRYGGASALRSEVQLLELEDVVGCRFRLCDLAPGGGGPGGGPGSGMPGCQPFSGESLPGSVGPKAVDATIGAELCR